MRKEERAIAEIMRNLSGILREMSRMIQNIEDLYVGIKDHEKLKFSRDEGAISLLEKTENEIKLGDLERIEEELSVSEEDIFIEDDLEEDRNEDTGDAEEDGEKEKLLDLLEEE